MRAIAIAPDHGWGDRGFLARSGWIPIDEGAVQIEGRTLYNLQLRWSDSDAEVDWKVLNEERGFLWRPR